MLCVRPYSLNFISGITVKHSITLYHSIGFQHETESTYAHFEPRSQHAGKHVTHLAITEMGPTLRTAKFLANYFLSILLVAESCYEIFQLRFFTLDWYDPRPARLFKVSFLNIEGCRKRLALLATDLRYNRFSSRRSRRIQHRESTIIMDGLTFQEHGS